MKQSKLLYLLTFFAGGLLVVGLQLVWGQHLSEENTVIGLIPRPEIFVPNQGGDTLGEHHQVQWVQAPRIPAKLDFAGELFPVENFDARERLDRELLLNCFRHSKTLRTMKLANRYFPLIERILKEEGVPDDFKYLAIAESDLTNAVSPAGARGVWQFMPATAEEYDLEVSEEVDERYHLEKSTRAACRYLKKAYAYLDSWFLAAAGYNMGSGRVKQNMQAQGVDSYFDLHLNTETSRYAFRILAFKLIWENPGLYGFHLQEADLYAPQAFDTVGVDSSVRNLIQFAQEQGTTYRMLKVFNPWLKKRSLENKQKKRYIIQLPRKRKKTTQSHE